jgi:uncharacterized damage-inducible protein DinB
MGHSAHLLRRTLSGMDAGFVALFRHHAWATDRLLAACEGLPPEHLEFVTQGAYGGLGATLRHLVEAEERYVSRLRGEGERPGPAPNQPDPPAPPEALAPSIPVLRRRAGSSGRSLVELAGTIGPEAMLQTTFRGEPVTLPAVVIFAQALDHGGEHRTQVRHALTVLGYDPPDIDAWAWDDAANGVEPAAGRVAEPHA